MTRQHLLFLWMLLTSGGIVLSGCGSISAAHQTQAAVQSRQRVANADLERLAERARHSVNDSEVQHPFVLGNSVPLGREVALPPGLQRQVKADVFFKGAAEVDLPTAALQLTRALGVPIRVRPDALQHSSQFSPKGPTGATAAPAAVLPRPVMVNLVVSDLSGADILDHVTHQSGTHWRYENGVVEIYRLVTRVFEIRTPAAKVSVVTGLGRAGSQGGAFESTSQTKVEQSGVDVVQDIKAQVDAMLTRGGTVVASNGTLVVTDTAESVARIAELLELENRALTRRITLLFEAIEVSTRDNTALAVNWDLLFKRLADAAAGVRADIATLESPRPLTSSTVGRLGLTVAGATRYAGSALILEALAEQGSVVHHTRVPMSTLNRRPVQYAVRTNFDYVSAIQVSTVASSAGTTTAPAITQKEETVGTVLTVTPTAFEGGQIVLNLAYDNTVLRSLEPYAVGNSPSALSTVQQKTIDGSGTVQSVALRSGQTVVISGIEKVADQFDQRRLDPWAPLAAGGASRTQRATSTTVLLVTAIAEEGF